VDQIGNGVRSLKIQENAYVAKLEIGIK